MTFLEKALEFIFLPSCGVCGKLGEGYLCKACEEKLKKYLLQENKEIHHVSSFFLFRYDGMIRNLILQYKFNGKSYLYKTFCEFMVKNKKVFDFIKSYDIIIPVPMYPGKMKIRGYNQSELLARELAKTLDITIETDVLIKIKDNKVQSTLTKKERKQNTKNVYKIQKEEKIKNKKVLLLDDIYTTGATINACITEIEKTDIAKIGIFTLAKD